MDPTELEERNAIEAELRIFSQLENLIGDIAARAVSQVSGGRDWFSLNGNTKTALGSETENYFKETFWLPDHHVVDTMLAGIPVDVKATSKSNWQIRPTCFEHWMVLFKLDIQRMLVSMGLFKAREHLLSRTGGSQFKRQISKEGRDTIHWLVVDQPITRMAPQPREPLDFDKVHVGRIDMRLWFDGIERPDVVEHLMSNGRFTGFLVEPYSASIIGDDFKHVDAKGFDLKSNCSDRLNVEVKSFTKHGAKLGPSTFYGAGRKADPLLFKSEIAPSKDFIIVDQTKLAESGEVHLVLKKGTDISDIGHTVPHGQRGVLFG